MCYLPCLVPITCGTTATDPTSAATASCSTYPEAAFREASASILAPGITNLPAKTGHDRTLLERQIASTDDEIDHLVYKLYGLADEEISVVEGSGG